jgi:NAD(P)-dependent dehydrogenase (short-subunit alcohol dehydrogenase family)
MTYLIVGCSYGIGEQIAIQLKAKGHKVIGISRTSATHVDEHISLDILTDQLPPIAEPLDGLVYCPGSINLKPFKGLKLDDYRRDLEINTFGLIKTLQQYQTNLKEAPNSSVVLFSTVAVQTGMAFHASIAVSKGAIEGLTRSLAAEWAPKIRVNCIAPSLTQTPLAGRLLDTEAKRVASEERHPLKKYGNSEHIAAMACFLLSDQADFMTGQIIKMDGGISAIKG